MADENDDLKGSGADDNADKQKSDKSGKSTEPKNDKSNKSNKDAQGDDDQDQVDPLDEKKFSQREINRIVKKATDKADKEKELTELQKLERERDEAKKELATIQQKGKFQTAIGLPENQANRLFNAFRDDMEFDDKGNIENLSEIKKLAKAEFPNLFTGLAPKGKSDGGEGNDAANKGGSMNDLIRRKAGRG